MTEQHLQGVDGCGHAKCDRPAGKLLCERCSDNLEALARALDEEGEQLTVSEVREQP